MSKLFRKLAGAIEKLEKIDYEGVCSKIESDVKLKVKNYSERYGCNGKKYFQKNLVIVSDSLDVRIVDSSDSFSVAIYLLEGIDFGLVSLSVDESEKGVLRIRSRCLQQNSHGFILISGFAGDSVKVSSKHGDIELNDTNVGIIDLESDNGDIEVDDSNFKRMNINTENGDVKVAIDGEVKLDVRARYGDVDIEDARNTANADRELVCRTKNGDITVKSK